MQFLPELRAGDCVVGLLEVDEAGEHLLAAAAVLVLQCPEHKGSLRCAALAPEAKLPFRPAAAGLCPI